MINDVVVQTFLEAAESWVCDGYSLDIRYIADTDGAEKRIFSAMITLNPLPTKIDLGFQIECSRFSIGQIQRLRESKKSLLRMLTKATTGTLELPNEQCMLQAVQSHDFYSEMNQRERWFSELHLQVIGSDRPAILTTELVNLDNKLRLSNPPFDGLADAASWLGLNPPGTTRVLPSIDMRVGPPVDLIFDRCGLIGDRLSLILHAHPKFDVTRVGLAVRATPGNALDARRQISNEIRWGRVRDGRREGSVQLSLQQADNVLAMLMIGTSTVRRQWFIDPGKARNNRLIAIQHFDKDLRMIRQAVFVSSDSAKFEKGVAALLFLLGFSPAIQVETDAPDLITATPSGKLAIIECTIKISDFTSKLGKLVDRRSALSKSMDTSGHPALVSSVLICRLPRDQIAAHTELLRAHNTILIAGEELEAAFNQVRFPNDPDRLLDEALMRTSDSPA